MKAEKLLTNPEFKEWFREAVTLASSEHFMKNFNGLLKAENLKPINTREELVETYSRIIGMALTVVVESRHYCAELFEKTQDSMPNGSSPSSE